MPKIRYQHTSGSTGKPKEWYIPQVYGLYIYIQNVFNYEENDIFWCTADIGWITGHPIYSMVRY
jgi:acetyl-CoA synthetase